MIRSAFVCHLSLLALFSGAATAGEIPELSADTPLNAERQSIPDPVAGTIMFLELDPLQVDFLGVLIAERDAAVAPLASELALLQAELDILLTVPGIDPAAVGTLVLEISNRQGGIDAATTALRVNFETVLREEQLARLDAARLAQDLQFVLPALGAVGLL